MLKKIFQSSVKSFFVGISFAIGMAVTVLLYAAVITAPGSGNIISSDWVNAVTKGINTYGNQRVSTE